jgi:carbohydrate-selective porin OprB
MDSRKWTTTLAKVFFGIRAYRASYFVLSVMLMAACARAQSTVSDPGRAVSTTERSFWNDQNYLLGDWGGERSRLSARGINFNFVYVSDFLGNPSGGQNQGFTDWGRIRGTVDIDLGKLTDTNAPTFHITGLWQNGGNLGAEDLGSIANPSSLVSASTFRMDSWWFEQALFNRHLFLRGGQFAGQDSYGVQEYGGSYLLEPLGYAFGNLFSTTHESFDPASTPAAEMRFVPNKHLYVKSAVLAGNRNPYADDTTGFGFVIKDSPVVVSEIGYLTNSPNLNASSSSKKIYPGKYKFGSSYNDGEFTDPVTGAKRSGNYLLYFMANQAVYRQESGSNRGLDLDFAVDWSPDDVNQINEQITGGFRYNGPLPHRANDSVAFGIVYSKVSDHFNQSYLLQSLPVLGAEKATELNYLFQATHWLVLQPAVQYFAEVGANPHKGDAVAAGFRTKVTF